MENQKVTVQKGRTIIAENKRSVNKITTLSMPKDINFNTQNTNYSNSFNNGINFNNLAGLIPLIKGLNNNDTSNMNISKILELLPNLQKNDNNQGNVLANLLPIIQAINTKKEDKQKISSYKRTDEE